MRINSWPVAATAETKLSMVPPNTVQIKSARNVANVLAAAESETSLAPKPKTPCNKEDVEEVALEQAVHKADTAFCKAWCLYFNNHFCAACRHHGHVTDELQGVAQALLGVNKYGFS